MPARFLPVFAACEGALAVRGERIKLQRPLGLRWGAGSWLRVAGEIEKEKEIGECRRDARDRLWKEGGRVRGRRKWLAMFRFDVDKGRNDVQVADQMEKGS